MGRKIEVMHFEVGKLPKVKTISATLEAMQKLVGGYIEPMAIDGEIVLFVNEEGRLDDLPTQFILGRTVYGNAFITRFDDDGESESLTQKDIRFLNRFVKLASESSEAR